MSRRVKPDPGQQCEHEGHELGKAEKNLRRVYYDKRGGFCYEWWCEDCRIDGDVSPMDDGWPTGEDGRFVTAVHCPTIPGLG